MSTPIVTRSNVLDEMTQDSRSAMPPARSGSSYPALARPSSGSFGPHEPVLSRYRAPSGGTKAAMSDTTPLRDRRVVRPERGLLRGGGAKTTHPSGHGHRHDTRNAPCRSPEAGRRRCPIFAMISPGVPRPSTSVYGDREENGRLHTPAQPSFSPRKPSIRASRGKGGLLHRVVPRVLEHVQLPAGEPLHPGRPHHLRGQGRIMGPGHGERGNLGPLDGPWKSSKAQSRK